MAGAPVIITRAAYWKLPNPREVLNTSEHIATLRNYENKIGNPATYRIHHLTDLLRRLQKGLQLYGDVSNAELQALVNQPQTQKPNRQELIAALDSIEEERTFHGFLDLPPELRQRIYYFAFAYTDNAYHLQQPAISRVCRIVRKESLPVFYETNRFGINVERVSGSYVSRVRHRQIIADIWPIYILNEQIAMMRFFEVNLLGDKTRMRVKIDLPCPLSGGELRVELWSVTPEKYMAGAYLREAQQQIERQIRPIIERLLASPGLGNFGTREVQQLALAAPVGVELKLTANRSMEF